jgi:glutathione S-transferase
MTAISDTATLQITRFIRAPREKVFDAFVDEAVLPRWHCPRGMSVKSASVDARVGGTWRIDMRSREGQAHVVGGRYREVRRPERLAYTWAWQESAEGMAGLETLIEIDFASKDDGTELRMRHSGFPSEGAREGHAQGWQSVFNRLSDLVDPRGSAGTLTLLGDARSSYTWAARLGFAEKGVAYTLQPCQPHGPELNAIHPFGVMPALRDGSTEIWETSAILRYVDEGFEGPSLNPGMLVDRARTEQWVSAVSAYMYDALARRYVLQYLFPRGADGQPDRAVIDQAVRDMVRPLDALERGYRGREYIGGATPSYADLLLAPLLTYIAMFPEGAQLLSDRPDIRRAQATMRARPSFAATQPPKG